MPLRLPGGRSNASRPGACPPTLAHADPVLYGEPLFADVVAGAVGVVLLQPTANWLPNLPAAC
jgi:hypothetical protein